MALDIFKLSGTIDLNTGKAELNLKRIDASAKQTQSALNKTGDAAKSAGGSFSKAANDAGRLSSAMGAMRGASGALGNAFAGIGTEILSGALSKLTQGFSAVIKTGLDFNKQMEAAQLVFTNLTGSADNAVKHLQGLKDFAKSSPFDLPDLIQASSRMQAFGFSAEEVLPKLKNIQNAAALAAGTSGNFTDSLQGITSALGKMRSQSRVSAEEMEMLTDRGVPAWDLLAKKIGLTVAETRKLSEQGRLRGAPAVEALVEAFGEGKFAGLGEKLSKTVLGEESNLRDALTQQAGEAGKDYFEAYRSGIRKARAAAQSSAALDAGKGVNKLAAENLTMGGEILDALTLTGNQQGKASVTAAFTELGMDAWRGFVQGLKQGTPDIMGTINGWIQTAKEGLGIKSPSTVFAEMGEDCMAGFDLGLEAGKRKPRSVINAEAVRQSTLEELQKLRNDPRIQALLETIAFSEGANYNTLFGGGTFSDFSQHPNQAITRKLGGKNLTSTAAGRYQFLKGTWNWASGQLGLPDFSPQSQDLAAIWLMKRRGMLGPTMEGDISGAFTKGSREWASLPGSPYGQPTQQAATLLNIFNTALEKLTGTTNIAAQTMQTFSAASTAATGSLPAFTMAGVAAKGVQLPSAAMPGGFMESVLSVDATLHDLGASMATLTTDGKALQKAVANTSLTTAEHYKKIVALDEVMKKATDHFADLKDAIADGIDNLIMDLVEGGRSIADTLKRFASDFFRSLLNGVFSSISGGKAGSPGQFFGNMLSGVFGGGGSAGGGFLTGGFAGGNPAQQILGGVTGGGGGFGGLGGILGKIPGIGKIFGGGANAAATSAGFPGVSVGKAAGGFNFAGLGAGGLVAGGGILGSFLGGKSGMGRLLGGIGGTLGAGALGATGLFGGGLAAALPAFFSNPITAIIGGALIGGALLSRLFGNKTLKSLRGLIRGEYGIEVKSDQVLGNIKAMGESKFGKAFKSKQIETIRLPDVREMLAEYAERTGQKGNSKLYSIGNLQDAYAPENTFTRRAMGGPLAAGQAAIVGERRPEVFVPNQSGYVYPSVGDFNSAQGGGGGDSRMFEVMVALVDAIQGLRSIPAGHLIERELRGNPDMATRAMVSSFRRRSDASIEARNLVNSR